MKIMCMLLVLLAGVAELRADTIPEFRAAAQSRLFVAPTGKCLPSGVINFALGGATASVGGSEFLGLCAIGLGDIAEIEVSTSQILANIFQNSEVIGTTALKFRIYSNQEVALKPSVAVALRSNQWSSISRVSSDLAGPAAGGSSNIEGVDFQAHLTALTLSSSFDFTPEFSSHLSVGWSELRLRNLTYSSQYLIGHPTPVPPDKIQKSTFGGTLGLEYSANPHTHSIVEAGALPQLKFSDDLKTIDLNTVWYGMAGLRFFFTPNTSVDAAIRYRGDYSGLSDAEIRVGVNLGIDVFGSVKKKKMEI